MSFRAQIKSPWFTSQSFGFSSFPKGFRRPGCHAKGSIGCSSEYPLLHFLAQVWKHTVWRLFFQGRCGASRIKKAPMHYLCIVKKTWFWEEKKDFWKMEQVYIKKKKAWQLQEKIYTYISVEWGQNCLDSGTQLLLSVTTSCRDTGKVRWYVVAMPLVQPWT